LAEAVAGLSRVAVLWNRSVPGKKLDWVHAAAAAERLGIELLPVPVECPEDLPEAVALATREEVGALLTLGDALTFRRQRQLISLMATHGLPAMYEHARFVTSGGLMAYGPQMADLYTRAAWYVGQILRGASAADLPIGFPEEFYLALNLYTAQTLSLVLPDSLVRLAREVVPASLPVDATKDQDSPRAPKPMRPK
jgi:putative ABC transport system substrate-binding protein